MDNRDFLPYMRVAKLPNFNPTFINSSSNSSRYPSFLSWLFDKFRLFYRYCYVHLHDLILSSLFGYLTLNGKLYVAIHENDLYKSQQLLSLGASPSYIPIDCKSIFAHLMRNNNQIRNSYTETGLFASILASDSMLYMAVSNNNYLLVRELIKYYDYGQIGRHTEVVSLCLAVKHHYTNIVEYLIDYGNINPNDCIKIGCKHCKSDRNDIQRFQFPLYHACRENHIDLVKYLIESKNCDMNQLTTSYETCLHGAILGAIENRFDSSINNQQRYSIVKYLLSKSNCNINLGLNPLCISLAHDKFYDYTNLLIQSNCNINRLGLNRFESSLRQRNSLLYSIDHPLNICLRLLCQTNVNTMISDHSIHKQHALAFIYHGSNIYAMYEYGPNYPFLLAVQTGDCSLVRAMLEQAQSYINFNIIEPLICACTKTYFDIVEILIDFGFNPNTITIKREYSELRNPNSFEINSSKFLTYLDSYCIYPSQTSLIQLNHAYSYDNSDQQMTPFLALSRMSTWIFHREKYLSTMQTLENLISHQSINFSLRLNRLAFYFNLINQHFPFVYYCLEYSCPIYLPYSTIDFPQYSSENHFSYTLFHLISFCCRLTANHRIQRVLFDSYAKFILKIHTYNRTTSMTNVLAYMKLWFDDEDFVYDPILFGHLMSLPYLDEIIEIYEKNQLRICFDKYYQRIIECRQYSNSLFSLKHICRLKIRQICQIICEHRQVNLWQIIQQIDYLPKMLHCYLFYTNIQSNCLINQLINKTSWNRIAWI